jgi:hypothetical protein
VQPNAEKRNASTAFDDVKTESTGENKRVKVNVTQEEVDGVLVFEIEDEQ